MNLRRALPELLACLISTLVTAWLLGALVAYVVDEMGPEQKDVLAQLNAPWLGGSEKATPEIRQIEPITVVGRREPEPIVTAGAGGR